MVVQVREIQPGRFQCIESTLEPCRTEVKVMPMLPHVVHPVNGVRTWACGAWHAIEEHWGGSKGGHIHDAMVEGEGRLLKTDCRHVYSVSIGKPHVGKPTEPLGRHLYIIRVDLVYIFYILRYLGIILKNHK